MKHDDNIICHDEFGGTYLMESLIIRNVLLLYCCLQGSGNKYYMEKLSQVIRRHTLHPNEHQQKK